MKAIYEFDPVEDKETLVLLARQYDVLSAIFDIKYNMKKRMESRIKMDEKLTNYDLLDIIFDDLNDKFFNIAAE